MKREILIPGHEISKKVQELGRRISSDYQGKEPICIGILNGVIFFFADLVRAMTIPYRIDFIRAASYGSSMTSSGELRLVKDVEMPILEKDLIIVEDIVDTGLTLNRIVKNLRERGPRSVRICALIDKRERREEEVPIDYWGFRVERGFLVGYGLDFDEQYRDLPDIYALT
ncbi:MAG: hypoxanthine phosphoribosyltransferase [Desulfobacterales bacterium]|nr:hypoxanthine phosphoribosyltransferase [Desulfobacterales bacterium]